MRVITLMNEKGGVGKTTIAYHFAAWLAVSGARVVIADADPQGHASVALGMHKAPGLYDLLVRDAPFADVLRPISKEIYEHPEVGCKGALYLIPGNVETRNIAGSISDAFAVAQKFDEIEPHVDYIVFDTSPTPSLLHGSIYLATNAIVYPTKCEYLSFDGLVESIQHRKQAEAHRQKWNLPPIQILGIVPTMFRHGTLEHAENLEELKSQFGDLVTEPLPQRTIWTEAARMHRTVWNFAPESKSSWEITTLTDRLKEKVL